MTGAQARKRRGAIVARIAVFTLGLAACGGKASPSSRVTAPTTVSGANAVDQEVQNLNQSLNQVNGDLAGADKAIANGG